MSKVSEEFKELAFEFLGYMDYLGIDTSRGLRENGEGGISYEGDHYRTTDRKVQEMYWDITRRLRKPKSRVNSMREKFEEFKKESIRGTREGKLRTLEDFKKFYQENYGDEDEVEELTTAVGGMDLSGAGGPAPAPAPAPAPVTAEEERLQAMIRPYVKENVVDRSTEVIGHETSKAGTIDMSGYSATGVGQRKNIGEKNAKAKLTPQQANEIRTRYWSGKFGGGEFISQYTLAKEYGLTQPGITTIINRTTWDYLPRVPHEPDSHFTKLNTTAKNVRRIAKKEGTEVIESKSGSIKRTDASILAQRKKKDDS